MKQETKCLHAGYTPKNGEPRALPIYQSTTYRYDSTDDIGGLFDLTKEGHMYSRISNPTVAAVEEKIAALEGGVGALCTTSGQAANLLAVLNICSAGDSMSSAPTIYVSELNASSLTPKLPKRKFRKRLNPIHVLFLVKLSQTLLSACLISKSLQISHTKTAFRLLLTILLRLPFSADLLSLVQIS